MSVMKKLVVGNWKMHGSRAFNAELIQGLLVADLATTAPNADVAVCPPCVFLADVADALQGSAIAVGTQDISAQTPGASTGEVAGPMIREFGATYAIVGHSERRSYHAESDQLVADKAKAALSESAFKTVNQRIGQLHAALHAQPIALAMDQTARTSWEESVAPHVAGVPFTMSGQGQQSAIKIALAMNRHAGHAKYVTIEEPENHLSHTSLVS